LRSAAETTKPRREADLRRRRRTVQLVIAVIADELEHVALATFE
jgi:hypothetical protein